MTKRTCNICGATSEKSAFYAGVTSRCADCHKAKVKENRSANAEYYKEYDALRFKNDPRVKERHKKYQATDAGKKSMRLAREKWMNEKPESRAAHIILGNAVRGGRVIKPTKCEKCGCIPKRRNLHAHHNDYTKPIDVIWLCSQCHSDHHK